MEGKPNSVGVDELLAERGWVERLARGLVHDPGAADDIVQETFVAAIEHPPRRMDALRPWLARVVTNLAFQRRRGEGRRAARERKAARAEGLPDTNELVERAEMQRRLAEEVLSLDEPFRRAVLLRYFHGLSSAEIARRSGVSAGSVRSQLRRGLDRLRARMDASHGGEREVWSATLLGLAGGVRASAPPVVGAGGGHLVGASSSAGSAPLLAGMLVMKGVLVFTVIAIVATGSVLGVWMSTRDAETTSTSDTVGGTPAVAIPHGVVGKSGTDQGLGELDDVAPERSAVPATGIGIASLTAVASDPAATTVLDARVVDVDGQPLAGATIALDESGTPSTSSTSDGRVVLDAGVRAQPASEVIVVRASGMADHYRRVLLRPADSLHLGDVELMRGGHIEGVVRDRDGGALADVLVQVTDLDVSRPDPEELRRLGPRTTLPVPTTRSGPDGRFRFEGVAAGSVRTWAGGGGFAWASATHVVVAGRTTPDVELVVESLADGDRIRGIVLSPDGQPLAGMNVSYRYVAVRIGSGGRDVTDESGRFAILVDHRVPHDIHVTDPKWRWAPVFHDGAEPGGNELEFRFEEARYLEVAAFDPDGAPVRNYQVEARSVDEDAHELFGWVRGTEHEGGVSELVLPTRPFQLVVTARGFVEWSQGPIDPRSAPKAIPVEFEPLPALTGRVVDPSGRPLEGVELRLCVRYGPELLVRHNGFRTLENAELQDRTFTDATGAFALYAREQANYMVRAETAGFAATVDGPIEHGPDRARSGLEIRMLHGGLIEGHVLVPVGDETAGFIVGINRGDGTPQSQRADSSGRFHFDGLTPGPWEVRLIEAEIHPGMRLASYGRGNGERIEWSCEVLEGETTLYDIDLRIRERSVVVGYARLGDHDLSGWTARLERWNDFTYTDAMASSQVSADGSFRLDAAPGAYRLVLSAPAESAGRLEIRDRLALEVGEQRWKFDRDAGRLTGEGAPIGERSETFFEYVWGDDEGDEVHAIVRIVMDLHGRFSLPIVPTGSALVRRKKPASAYRPSPWETVANVMVAPGETAHVRIP